MPGSLSKQPQPCEVRKLDIYPLDPRTIPTEGMFAIIGRTQSGKSTIARSLLYHIRKKFDYALVLCGSKKDAKKWERHVPGLFVHTTFNNVALSKILAMCEKAEDMGQPKRAVIIVDDALYSSNTKNSAIMEDLACRGRQANILTIAMMHDVKDVSVKNRGQFKMVMLCFEGNRELRRRMYETFNPCFEYEEEFEHAFKACTQNFGALGLWLENRHSYDVSEYAFSYKAPWPEREYKFNKRSPQWEAHRRFFDPDYKLRKYRDEKRQESLAKGNAATPTNTFTIGAAPKYIPSRPYQPRYDANGSLVDGPFDLSRRGTSKRATILKVHTAPKARRLRTM